MSQFIRKLTGEAKAIPTITASSTSDLANIEITSAIVSGSVSNIIGVGQYKWDPNSSATDSPPDVIKPTGRVGNGRWLLIVSGGGTFVGAGDLSGDSTSQTVVGIKNATIINGFPNINGALTSLAPISGGIAVEARPGNPAGDNIWATAYSYPPGFAQGSNHPSKSYLFRGNFVDGYVDAQAAYKYQHNLPSEFELDFTQLVYGADGFLWVGARVSDGGTYTGAVYKINPATGAVVASVDLLHPVRAIKYDSSANKIWVIYGDSSTDISRIDAGTTTVDFTNNLGAENYSLIIADGYVWVGQDSQILHINPISGDVADTIVFPRGLSGVPTSLTFAATMNSILILVPSGGPAQYGTLHLLDVGTLIMTGEALSFDTHINPIAIIWEPAITELYVVCAGEPGLTSPKIAVTGDGLTSLYLDMNSNLSGKGAHDDSEFQIVLSSNLNGAGRHAALFLDHGLSSIVAIDQSSVIGNITYGFEYVNTQLSNTSLQGPIDGRKITSSTNRLMSRLPLQTETTFTCDSVNDLIVFRQDLTADYTMYLNNGDTLSDGQQVTIKAPSNAGVFRVIVDGNGHMIDGSNQYIISNPYQAETFVWDSVNSIWIVI